MLTTTHIPYKASPHTLATSNEMVIAHGPLFRLVVGNSHTHEGKET